MSKKEEAAIYKEDITDLNDITDEVKKTHPIMEEHAEMNVEDLIKAYLTYLKFKKEVPEDEQT